jgi:hypothetical protein
MFVLTKFVVTGLSWKVDIHWDNEEILWVYGSQKEPGIRAFCPVVSQLSPVRMLI